ncbi:MAG TPA: MBL fold metallo-hydrolase [bacterium]
MKFCVIASGSEGNCTLVEDSSGNAILVDAGLPLRRIAACLENLRRDFARVQAVLISHEHSDHLRGAAVLSRRQDLPIFASLGTITMARRIFPHGTSLHPIDGEALSFGNLRVQAFNVNHDAMEALGFLISEGDSRLAIATDLGTVDLSTLSFLQNCDAVVLEANHDLQMLLDGPYPWELKQRIQSNLGHLSNDQAAEALLKVAGPRLRLVVLSHLSQENNAPELALNQVRAQLLDAGHHHIEVVVANQHWPTDFFEI